MKKYFVKFMAICAAFVLTGTVSFAQNNKKTSPTAEKYVISAKAGGVNFVSGKVAVVRKNGKSGYLLKGDSLEAGDRVLTGSEGRTEILLNPGSFARLAGNSEFEFATTSLDDLRVRVNSGSAIFEVLTTGEFSVVVSTPKSSFNIVRTGIYRVDTMSDGTGKIEVWKGRAQIVGEGVALLKTGQTMIGNSGEVAKFDRKDKDEFEMWSKERAKELDKVNARLRGREMNRALMSSFSQSGWNGRHSAGLWVFDPFSRNYCFLPFGYHFTSPYGLWYGNTIWNYRIPPAIRYVVNTNNNQPQNGQQPAPTNQPRPTQPGNGFPAPGGNPSINPSPTREPSPMRDVGTPRGVDRREMPIID